MFIFQSQASAAISPSSKSPHGQQNATYNVVFINFEQLRFDVFDYAKKKGYRNDGATFFADYAHGRASQIMTLILDKHGVSSGKVIDDKTMQKIIKEFKTEFARDMLTTEKTVAAIIGKKADAGSVIGAMISASFEAHQICQDSKKVDAIISNYGLNDSKLRNFLEQLPNAFADYLSKGVPGAIAYNLDRQIQTGRRIEFMKETEEITNDIIEKEKNKKRI